MNIKDELDRLSLNKIETAKSIFASTLLIEFPTEKLPLMGNAVKMRHHIVHRDGKYEESHLLSIDSDSVSEVAEGILEFTREIDAQIRDGYVPDHEYDGDNQTC